jgi:hypothetical protein
MTRRKLIDASTHVQIYIPESLKVKMDLELYSELEQKVPFGARGKLLGELISEWLKSRGVEV